jgi:hypothetical protein
MSSDRTTAAPRRPTNYNRPDGGDGVTSIAQSQAIREASLLVLPRWPREVEFEELVEAARLLLLARTREDREIIGLRLMQKIPFVQVAERLGSTVQRVKEVLASLRRREKELAGLAAHREMLEALGGFEGKTYRLTEQRAMPAVADDGRDE